MQPRMVVSATPPAMKQPFMAQTGSGAGPGAIQQEARAQGSRVETGGSSVSRARRAQPQSRASS